MVNTVAFFARNFFATFTAASFASLLPNLLTTATLFNFNRDYPQNLLKNDVFPFQLGKTIKNEVELTVLIRNELRTSRSLG